jgi:hypothetical protein
MSETSTNATDVPADWMARRGPAPGLGRLAGRIGLRVANAHIAVLTVGDAVAEISPGGEPVGGASLNTDSLATLVALLGGDLHPIVARLQNRMTADGDVGFVIRVCLGLRAGSPWTGLVSRS